MFIIREIYFLIIIEIFFYVYDVCFSKFLIDNIIVFGYFFFNFVILLLFFVNVFFIVLYICFVYFLFLFDVKIFNESLCF